MAGFLERIARYKSMLVAEPDCAEELRPVIERLHAEMTRSRHRANRSVALRSAVQLPAKKMYRDHVAGIAKVLNEKQIGAARAVLKDVLGEIPVQPDPTGRFLIAKMAIHATPLWRAAGIGRIGSGGRI
jgi:hypothetical protein